MIVTMELFTVECDTCEDWHRFEWDKLSESVPEAEFWAKNDGWMVDGKHVCPICAGEER